jgi:hypothetical protein
LKFTTSLLPTRLPSKQDFASTLSTREVADVDPLEALRVE